MVLWIPGALAFISASNPASAKRTRALQAADDVSTTSSAPFCITLTSESRISAGRAALIHCNQLCWAARPRANPCSHAWLFIMLPTLCGAGRNDLRPGRAAALVRFCGTGCLFWVSFLGIVSRNELGNVHWGAQCRAQCWSTMIAGWINFKALILAPNVRVPRCA